MTTLTKTSFAPLPEMPTIRGGAAVAAARGKVYVLGGGVSFRDHLRTTECFDPKSNQWSKLPPMPTPRSNAASVASGNRIYVIGGLVTPAGAAESEPCAAFEYFDVSTATWKKAADLPQARVKPAVGAVGGTIYAISGRRDDDNADTVFAYGPAADQWSEVCKSPVTVRHPAACVLGDTLYMSGGTTYAKNAEGKLKGRSLKSVFAFNPKTNVFSPLPDLRATRTSHGMVGVGSKLFIFGGRTDEKLPAFDIDVFDLGGSQWHTVDACDSARMIFEACVVGSTAYLMGGWIKNYKEANKACLAYQLPVD